MAHLPALPAVAPVVYPVAPRVVYHAVYPATCPAALHAVHPVAHRAVDPVNPERHLHIKIKVLYKLVFKKNETQGSQVEE